MKRQSDWLADSVPVAGRTPTIKTTLGALHLIPISTRAGTEAEAKAETLLFRRRHLESLEHVLRLVACVMRQTNFERALLTTGAICCCFVISTWSTGRLFRFNLVIIGLIWDTHIQFPNEQQDQQ